jgi:hypothetical protein
MSEPAYQVSLAQTFQEALQRLPAAQSAAVFEAITRLQKGHGSAHLHALHGVPWVAFNVTKGAQRIICLREGEDLLLAWVDSHDDAYQWAVRHQPRRFGHVLRFLKVDVSDDDAGADAARATVADDTVPPGPLASIRDKTFRLVGISPGLGALLRGVNDDDLLLDLCSHLDQPTAEALVSLAADPDDVAGIVHRFGQAKEGKTTSLGDAVRATVNADRVWVLPPETAAIEAALSAGAAAWRVFLHPSQKRLVTMKATGPILVTGGPGTGKTIVALHRARHLIETSAATPEAKPVLLTTFSRVLARHLEDGMAVLCADQPDLVARCRVRTLTAAARDVLATAKMPSALLVGDDVDAAWNEALKAETLGRSRAFYEAERRDVVLPRGVTDEATYLKTPRPGRGGRLERTSKQKIWHVLSAFADAIARRGGDDPAGLAWRATRLLQEGVVQSPYSAVVCDEVQDASLPELALLAVLSGPATGPQSLFLVGDGHQRLYSKPVSLRAAGIEVRGRSVRLRLNYRTTQGICSAALSLIDGVDLDVLETEAHNADELGGYRSVRAGPRPLQRSFPSEDDEANAIADDVKAGPGPTLILCRTKAGLERLQQRLRTRGVAAPILGDLDGMPEGVAAVLATLHRCKGLEAATVILASQQEVPQRYIGSGAGVGDDDDRARWVRQERLLQYVGMTRARDRCLITRVA